ncbi:hypothetical protein [Vibrio algarum]|uniref:hypothetical protein n=1 Tax=Vibrio algarum TaxID=3020714 RepID=UPI003899C769
MFVQRIRAFIGSYMVQIGGVDAILFTRGIREYSASIRFSVCKGLNRLGINVDEDKNATLQIATSSSGVCVIDSFNKPA